MPAVKNNGCSVAVDCQNSICDCLKASPNCHCKQQTIPGYNNNCYSKKRKKRKEDSLHARLNNHYKAWNYKKKEA